MADKPLHEMTFNELVKEGVEIELDFIVQGAPLKRRVYALMDYAARWATERAEKRHAKISN